MAINDESSDVLSARQQQAVLALVTCRTVNEASKMSSVSVKTLERWRRLPAFQAALRQAERDVYRDGLRTLLADQLVNMNRIMQLREKGDNDAVRLRAALGLEAALSRRFEGLKTEEIEERLAALEAHDN